MNLLVILIVLMLLFGGGGFYLGGPIVGGGGFGLILLILLVLLLTGRLGRRPEGVGRSRFWITASVSKIMEGHYAQIALVSGNYQSSLMHDPLVVLHHFIFSGKDATHIS